jgi:uncharacterized protein
LLATVAADWPEMLAVVLTTILQAGLVSWLVVRFGTLPGSVAAWGLSPGAAAAMVGMAEDYGADPRLVAFMQYLRVACVVITASVVARLLAGQHEAAAAVPAPPLQPEATGPVLSVAATIVLAAAGAWLGRRFRLPAGALLVPMFAGAALGATGILTIAVPQPVLALAYAIVGWYVGLRFTRETVSYAFRAVPQMLLATGAMLVLGALSAWLLSRLLGVDYLTAFLATSPGGLDSVAIIAVGSGADVPFVLALQTLRLVLVILTGPVTAKFVARTAARPA